MDVRALEDRYQERTPNSHSLFLRATERVPGGVHGNIKFFAPYPLSFRRANGAWLEDVDGHRYIDYLLSFGALVMGHGHSLIQDAVATVFANQGTTAFGVPTPFELELADEIAAFYPSCEQVRFTNSGLEATLLAIRLGMALTGRSYIAKFVGHYHGGHDQVLVSVQPPTPDTVVSTPNAVATVFAKQGTTAFGVPTPFELELADEMAAFYPSCEQVRFTNSGLEATLLAIRLGMAFTGRSHIAKFVGHYHGGHDQVLVSVQPPTPDTVVSTPDSLRLPDYILDHTVVLPFNDWPACARILQEQRHQVGVVIVEPMAVGVIPAEPGFMPSLRDLTRELDMVLIFDEVKTGFRVALGGAQEYYGVSPDLTALGKILGGGFPIGAVGGRRDIMALCSPLRSRRVDEVVFHSGTFNGNPVSVAAGLATLRALRQDGTFPNLLQRTATLRRGIEALGEAAGFPIQTIGVGAVFDVVFTRAPIRNYSDHTGAPRDLRRALDFLLMERGVFSKPMNRFSLSIVHGSREVDLTLDAFRDAFQVLAAMI